MNNSSYPSDLDGAKTHKGLLRDLHSKYGTDRFIVAALIALAVISMFIPAEIPVPDRFVDDLRKEGEIASITYLGEEEGASKFEVYANPENFNILADVDLPETVEPGTRGYIGTSSGKLVLDGSYEHKYDFLFPRQGNLFQRITTDMGGWTLFNRPSLGRVKSMPAVVYENQELGFTAAFPVLPEEVGSTSTLSEFGEISETRFLGYRDSEFTVVGVFESMAMEGLLGSSSEEKRDAFLTEGVEYLFQTYLEGEDGGAGLDPKEPEHEITRSTIDGLPCASAISPFVFRGSGEGGEDVDVYCYSLCVVKEKWCYCVFGARKTYEAAQEALQSFQLL